MFLEIFTDAFMIAINAIIFLLGILTPFAILIVSAIVGLYILGVFLKGIKSMKGNKGFAQIGILFVVAFCLAVPSMNYKPNKVYIYTDEICKDVIVETVINKTKTINEIRESRKQLCAKLRKW